MRRGGEERWSGRRRADKGEKRGETRQTKQEALNGAETFTNAKCFFDLSSSPKNASCFPPFVFWVWYLEKTACEDSSERTEDIFPTSMTGALQLWLKVPHPQHLLELRAPYSCINGCQMEFGIKKKDRTNDETDMLEENWESRHSSPSSQTLWSKSKMWSDRSKKYLEFNK